MNNKDARSNMEEKVEPDFAYPPGNSLYHCLDHLLARPMFWLSFVFLILMAGVLHRQEQGQLSRIETIILTWMLAVLWPIFIAEAVLRFLMRSRQLSFWPRLSYLILNIALPPVRMGAKSYLDTHLIWLPFIGWNHVDKILRRRLEKSFSIPMIIIAFMVLPFLALEFFWDKAVHESMFLELTLDIGTSIIWAAFALEFILMLSVARKKIQYCIQHWIDVAVVCLPLLDFLPLVRVLRISRLISVQKLSQMGRLYRLRGLLMRAWRSILVLEVLNRLLLSKPQKRLRQLRELEVAKEEELDDLRTEIAELEKQLAAEEDDKEESLDDEKRVFVSKQP